MAERLDELLRQRRLIEQHLAWLDHEISLARGESEPAPPAMAEPPGSRTAPSAPTSAGAGKEASPAIGEDSILAEYQQDPQHLQQDVRKGCLTAFVAGMAIFLGTIGIAYFFYARHLAARDPGKAPPPVEKRTHP